MLDSSDPRLTRGRTLIGSDGRTIGSIADVYVSNDSGGTTFATVRGDSGRPSFFPLGLAEERGGDLVLPFAADHVLGAPHVADEEEISPQEESSLAAYYSLSGTGTPRTGESDGTVIRSEERMRVGTEQVEAGRARLRKYIVTETETRPVELRRDEVSVVHEPLAEGAVPAPMELTEEVHELVLTEERPVVDKEVVAVERVRLRAESVAEQVEVQAEVRKEQIDLTEVRDGEAPAGADEGAETRTTSELFLAPRGVTPEGDDGTRTTSELFIAPRH